MTTIVVEAVPASSATMCSIIGLLTSGIIGFGLVARERPQTRAFTAGQDDGLHGRASWWRVCPALAAARRRASGT